MKYNYNFFKESVHRPRKLRSFSIDKSYLLDAPSQVFPDLDLGVTPRVLEGGEDDPSQVILTRSYAREPGNDLKDLKLVLNNHIPEDFLEFHRLWGESLITTRSYPIHLWDERKILDGITMWRDLHPSSLRFFRFGEYWDRDELWFGLWQEIPQLNEWKVIITSHDNRDDALDFGRTAEYILAPSFYVWLKDFVERDGVPDPFMTDFGALEPV